MSRGFLGKSLSLTSYRYVFADFQVNLTNGTDKSSDQEKNAANSTRTIPTFLTLYIFGLLYQLVLVWDALRLKNTIQVIGLCLYNVGLLIYAAVQMDQIKDAVYQLAQQNESNPNVWSTTKPYLIAIPCVLALGTTLLSLVAWKLYDEFAWTIYKHISADLRMKRRYLTFQVRFGQLSQAAFTLMRFSDLYYPPQVRFFLFSWVHNPIRRYPLKHRGP